MPVRSDVIVPVQNMPGGGTGVTFATVPAGERWIIKRWHMRFGAAGTFAIYVVRAGTQYQARTFNYAGADGGAPDGEEWMVLNAGDVLRGATFQSSTTVGASGVKLTL